MCVTELGLNMYKNISVNPNGFSCILNLHHRGLGCKFAHLTLPMDKKCIFSTIQVITER